MTLKKFLICLLSLLVASSCSSHKVVSKPDNQLYCHSDKDCRVVEKACGEKAVINANHVKAFEARISEISGIIDCSQFWEMKQNRKRAKAVCQEQKCMLDIAQ